LELGLPATRAENERLAEWAVRQIRLDGKPLSFEGHSYLKGIYDDTAPHVVLMKAAQIGGTAFAIIRSLHACQSGLNVLYLFPTKTDVLEFSKSRVSPLIADNPFLSKAIRDTNTAGLKRIGEAHLYLRGMESPVGLKSVPADMIVFDELDESTPDAKMRALESMSHSSFRRLIELSKMTGQCVFGIDIQRRSKFLRQLFKGDTFAEQFISNVTKIMHGRRLRSGD
jgi:hypothetical protein